MFTTALNFVCRNSYFYHHILLCIIREYCTSLCLIMEVRRNYFTSLAQLSLQKKLLCSQRYTNKQQYNDSNQRILLEHLSYTREPFMTLTKKKSVVKNIKTKIESKLFHSSMCSNKQTKKKTNVQPDILVTTL